MAIVVLQGPNGVRRVPSDKPYRKLPGEKIIGTEQSTEEMEINQQLANEGLQLGEKGLGDFIEDAFKILPASIRPKHCSKCEKRKLVLNRIKEIGWKETFRQLREIKDD